MLVIRTIERETRYDLKKKRRHNHPLSHIFLKCVCMSEYVTAICFLKFRDLLALDRSALKRSRDIPVLVSVSAALEIFQKL